MERDRKEDNFYNNSNSQTEVFHLTINPVDIWCLKTFGLTKSKLICVHLKYRSCDKIRVMKFE